MSYEHGTAGGRFNLPNPMKAENLIYGISGGICLVFGLILLFVSRGKLESSGSGWGPTVLALALLMMGGTYGALTFSQLRFFFGRGLPRNLAAGEIARGRTGSVQGAEELKEILRHQALVFPEPQGPVNGLLYTLVPNLIYAVLPIQALARQQFANAINVILTFLMLAIALASGAAGQHSGAWNVAQEWIGMAALLYLLFILFLAPTGAGLDDKASQSKLSVQSIAIRLVLAVVVPVFLVQAAGSIPAMTGFSPFPHIFVLIALTLGAYALVFFVLLKEGNDAPATAVSQVQEAWSLHCHPGQVVGEFDRIMQGSWRDQIPNRVYTRLEPTIDPEARTGQFTAEMLEEYQPMPLDSKTPQLSDLLQNPKTRLLVGLTVFAGVNVLASGFCLFVLGLLSLGKEPVSATWLLYAIMTGSLASGCHRVAHALWQRFDFGSVLVFCEMKGQYVKAELQHGNLMRDKVKATSSVTQIESMTFRLWVASLQTVSFGKNAQRYIRAMQPEDDAAKTLATKLRTFAQEQAIILAPTAQADQDRDASLQKLNAQTPPALATDTQELPTLASLEAPKAMPTMKFCSACGERIIPTQRFCSGCGVALALPAES